MTIFVSNAADIGRAPYQSGGGIYPYNSSNLYELFLKFPTANRLSSKRRVFKPLSGQSIPESLALVEVRTVSAAWRGRCIAGSFKSP
jgi:hypothetical protein